MCAATGPTPADPGKISHAKAGSPSIPDDPGKLSFAKAGIPSNASMRLPPKPGNTHGDILFRAASAVVIPPRSIRKVQVSYPAVANPPGKKRHHFLLDATDESGNPLNPDDPFEVGALPAVVPFPRGQQAVGNKVSVFMVNNTDQPQSVMAHAVVGRGSLTQEQENLAETLSQVGADLHIQRVHGVRTGGGEDLSDAPPPKSKLTKNF